MHLVYFIRFPPSELASESPDFLVEQGHFKRTLPYLIRASILSAHHSVWEFGERECFAATVVDRRGWTQLLHNA